MLVLTRKQGESIIIGDNVQVMMLGFDNLGGIKLGVAAPKDVPVHRQEVYQRIEQGIPQKKQTSVN